MNVLIYKALRRVRQDFMRLSDTLQSMENLSDSIKKNIIENNDDFFTDVPKATYFWLPRVLVNYQCAIRDILKVTLMPDQELLKHLDMNDQLSEEDKKKIMELLCKGSTLLANQDVQDSDNAA